VLAFSMGRAAFPIDTHVHRIAARLGWIPTGATAEQAYRALNPAVPPAIRYDLHLAFIAHGRAVCKARNPDCRTCVLREMCPYAARVAEKDRLAGRAGCRWTTT
jgi:endonuclease-3